MKSILLICSILFLMVACTTPEKKSTKLFNQFTRSFKTINLPMDISLLYRVHSSEIVSARIDTTMIQQFINKNYKLRANMPAYDGYGYGIRLPKEDSLLYEGLVYYESKGQEQFFILNTYSLDGQLVYSLPISGDSSSYKRLTGSISRERTITIKNFISNQPEKGAIEYLYKIKTDGEIIPLDTFYLK